MKALTFLSFVCLTVMLAGIRVDVPVPYLEYGDFSAVLSKPAPTFSGRPEPIQLARSEPEHDSLIVVGDVMLARNLEFLMDRFGRDYPFQGIDFTTFSSRPFVVGNFEAAIPEVHVPTPAQMLDFSVRPDHAEALHRASFTLVSLANNHAYDFGMAGYRHTMEALTALEVRTFGHPSELGQASIERIVVDGVPVAIIALHALEQLPTQSELDSLFKSASKGTEYQIVYVHWGTEYYETSDETQRRLARMYVDAGADLVIGHHPHVVQEVGLVDGVPVIYSLGNYIFDQYFSDEVQIGLLLHLEFDGDPVVSLQPVSSLSVLSQPNLMNPRDHATFLKELSEKSDPDIQEAVAEGVIPLHLPVATKPKIAMISR